MKAFFFLTLILVATSSCSRNKEIDFQITTFEIPDVSIRAIEAIDKKTMWFAGSNGQVGFTKTEGLSFEIDTISYDKLRPEFRSIAVTDSAVFVLSIASPALLYKSTENEKNWKLVYKEDNPSTFYNAMTISKNGFGVAVGDPIGDCLSVIITENSGNNWRKIPCDSLPIVVTGEAGFAASNSNVNIVGDNVWLVSGGTRARVFHSENKGETWRVYNTPIVQGGQMTGIFSSHFYDSQNGIIVGGDWNQKNKNTENKAITKDGGKTWTLIADGQGPSYRSSVRYIPGSNGKELIAVGTPGISYSKDGGLNWKKISEESFYTIRFTPDGKSAWLAGSGKIGKLELTDQ
ncbi:MAG: oxidoreductase [Balneola sp.]|jgi:photosystem II stability/assembly factor-like uncharacterized protein|tara:strand:+ start:149677 stop:150717 length:1041 start_codon:yes stop_codon:yes gene_type:complete